MSTRGHDGLRPSWSLLRSGVVESSFGTDDAETVTPPWLQRSELHGAQTRDALLGRRVRGEVVLHLPRPSATRRATLELRLRLHLERVDDVRALLRRAHLLHRDALRVDVDLLERACERLAGAEQLRATGVGVELARARDRHLDQAGGERREDQHRDGADR